MAKAKYSKELCKQLLRAVQNPILKFKRRITRYEVGDAIRISLQGVSPAINGSGTLVVERFLGGGFAGQVYQCRLSALSLPKQKTIEGLAPNRPYAVKIIIPPSRFSHWFRNTVYWLAFQGPFSAQVNHGACRSGLLLQKLIRRAATLQFGRETAIKDAYASFYDPNLNAYGEITEWIEGRMWNLEADCELKGRREWKSVPLSETGSPEYIAKRRFMAEMVELMHAMGAPEFARQYEWWTLKSQPNAMKRTDLPNCDGPGEGLCAIDFRAGLALLPWLPMSPGDIKLIFDGLFRRHSLVQFDRCDIAQMRAFFEAHPKTFGDLQPAIDEFFEQDQLYRRSLPDITHHGIHLLFDRDLRQSVRAGLIEGWLAADLVDEPFAKKLQRGGLRFGAFYLIGAIPLLGQMIRQRWGNRAVREHIATFLIRAPYRSAALRARAAHGLIGWHRAGRVDERHAHFLVHHPILFLIEQITLGVLPIFLHRVLLRPQRIGQRLREGWTFLKTFITRAEFREQWFLNEIAQGERDGMLTPAERIELEGIVSDPFIVKYLKCLGVHFATVPVTQIVSVIGGAIWAAWLLLNGHPWEHAAGAFGGTLLFFQIFPISPGSLCRGGFVVYLMVRERNLRDYLIAAPVSFLKYVGYLAFPLQMTTTYPHLARFMASRWATNMVHIVPVFGEKGALLEHWVFDQFFNRPQKAAAWAAPRLKGLLFGWLLVGVFGAGLVLYLRPTWLESPKDYVNLILATVVLFILPRLLFYPLMSRKAAKAPQSSRGRCACRPCPGPRAHSGDAVD